MPEEAQRPEITLTQWWQQLHQEAIRAAHAAGIDYPQDDLVQEPGIDDSALIEQTKGKWLALYKMACLGTIIEPTAAKGLLAMRHLPGVKDSIKKAESCIGTRSTINPDYFLPKITDAESLWFALVYYRHLKRFQDIHATNAYVHDGAFNIPGLAQSKPYVKAHNEELATRIGLFCGQNKEIAQQVKAQFIQQFDNVGEDELKALEGMDLSEILVQHFKDEATEVLLGGKPQQVQDKRISSDHLLIALDAYYLKLAKTRKILKHIYLQKKLLAFINYVERQNLQVMGITCIAQCQASDFINYLKFDPSYQSNEDLFEEEAQFLWAHTTKKAREASELSALRFHQRLYNYTLAKGSRVSQGLSHYVPTVVSKPVGWLGQTVGFVSRATGMTWLGNKALNGLGLHADAQDNAKTKQFTKSMIEITERNLSHSYAKGAVTTGLKEDQLSLASTDNIVSLLDATQKLRKEIHAVKETLKAYKADYGQAKIIRFSTWRLFGWITKQMMKFEFTSRLLHDNLHFLQIASDSEAELKGLERDMDSPEYNHQDALERFKAIKQRAKERTDSVYDKSWYLLWKKERQNAHLKLHNALDRETPSTAAVCA